MEMEVDEFHMEVDEFPMYFVERIYIHFLIHWI